MLVSSIPPSPEAHHEANKPRTIATGAERLRAEISGHLACVTISYPERHNIIDLEGWLAFPDLMARLVDNQDVRLIVLRGDGGKAFVAGADIAQFAEKFSGSVSSEYDAATVNAFDAVTQCPLPTLAAIEGYCIGGGLGSVSYTHLTLPTTTIV